MHRISVFHRLSRIGIKSAMDISFDIWDGCARIFSDISHHPVADDFKLVDIRNHEDLEQDLVVMISIEPFKNIALKRDDAKRLVVFVKEIVEGHCLTGVIVRVSISTEATLCATAEVEAYVPHRTLVSS